MMCIRIGIGVLMACVGAGCGTLRFGRLASYQALPLTAEAFLAADQYAVVLIPQPFVLHASEQGNAWQLLVRRPDASIVPVVAVQYQVPDARTTCTSTVGLLIAMLPEAPERYRDAEGVLIAHDGKRCFGARGTMFPCAWKSAWTYARPLSVIPVTTRAHDPTDERLRAWYDERLRFATVRTHNTVLSEEEYERIAWEESVWRDMRDVGIPAGAAGITAGALSQNVFTGLAVAGVTFFVQLPFALSRVSMGPEYGDVPMPASAVAALSDALRSCVAAPQALSPHASQ
ncbi:hypothetical protein HY632_04455 [Candidatus Uhrbacteria bacterium]|nr:hypothetical protein [Candidatus Uhrbacteria bacterium]